jgi:hypothetical protein
MPIPLGAAIFCWMLLHGKEYFRAIVVLTVFSVVYFVILYSLMFFWYRGVLHLSTVSQNPPG